MILPNDAAEQQSLFETFMRASNGCQLRTIKAAGLNLLLTAILQTSSSREEAILQWNELSSRAQSIFDQCAKRKADDFNSVKLRFNGG